MSTVPLRANAFEEGVRPRDWQPRRSECKVPFRLLRLCILGAFLPAALVAGPIYLRYRVYSEQLYPLAITDQRLIDARISTTWCQSQVVRANTTFNAYLMNDAPKMKNEMVPVSMTRYLILEDDMKEYWGFYLLRGSSVTVSTCVRWPGASLTIIRGHKHLHECAFIGDDSSEELEEVLEIAKEQGLLIKNGTEEEGKSNAPEKMKRAKQGILFHRNETMSGNSTGTNVTDETSGLASYYGGSHELDAHMMKNILNHLFAKTLVTKKKQEETPHHHYEGTFVESKNIDKPVSIDEHRRRTFNKSSDSKTNRTKILSGDEKIEKASNTNKNNTSDPVKLEEIGKVTETLQSMMKNNTKDVRKIEESVDQIKDTHSESTATSAEIFRDIFQKIESLGHRGKSLLRKLQKEIDGKSDEEEIRKVIDSSIKEERRKRDLLLSSPLLQELTTEDDDEDAAIEKDTLHPDGIAEDRGTVDEKTMNDKSNSEFWSSFSSSEERLLECKGLILNLPLTPHRYCTPRHESRHADASFANTVTYRVPTDGYYFFVFNSENEIQPNYLRVRFDLLKTTYNTSNALRTCENSTSECSLPFNIFSNERTILELPLGSNDSQWNQEYVVVSTCVPRTSVYLVCITLVPLLILFFAFH